MTLYLLIGLGNQVAMDPTGLQNAHPVWVSLDHSLYGISPSPPSPLPEAVKKFNGRDALLRVHDSKPNTDAEHRVPTESGLQAQTNFFIAPRGGARGPDSSDFDPSLEA